MGKANRRLLICLCIINLFYSKVFAEAAEFDEYYINEYQEIERQPTPADRVTLNADRVSFNDETGQAYAEGNAILTYNDTTIMAERIEYDADTQQIQAMPLPGSQIILTNGQRAVKGDTLNYDLNSQEGMLRGALTQAAVGEDGGVLYVSGAELNVIPWDIAMERGLVKGSESDYLMELKSVTLTTCALEHPHYRLESKSISFIPGKKLTARKPRVYLGETYLFTSPLDYVVQLERKAIDYSFIPYFQKSSSKGSGGGVTGSFGWDTGSASIGLAGFSESGIETMFKIRQQVGKNLSLIAGADYSWDEEWDDKVWRPYVSLIYSFKSGWETQLNWSKNEYIDDQKDSKTDFKGRLERAPELIITSPYYKSSLNSWTLVYAAFGRFRETIYQEPDSDAILRYGLGLRTYYEKTLREKNNIELFSNNQATVWFYDKDNDDHEMFRSFTGLRYTIGAFELGTAFERQYYWGESPMHWDQYKNRKRLHQKIRVPAGKEIFLVFRGSYDLYESFVDEIIYSIQWITDCMLWELYYKNDRRVDGDDKIGLSLSLTAFPEAEASFGQDREVDPFVRPRELPKE